MGHPLIPDLSATVDVDPREAVLELHGDEAALAEYRSVGSGAAYSATSSIPTFEQ